MSGPDVLAVVHRLLEATNDHDLDGIVACFAVDYRNATPAHPGRSFSGSDQVRRNWSVMLQAIPDLRAEILAEAVDADTAWTEWCMTGTRHDGTSHHMVGAIVFVVHRDRISEARFYLEPVDQDGGTVDTAVRNQTVRSRA
jgi:ketosteroid isomerase-like protein